MTSAMPESDDEVETTCHTPFSRLCDFLVSDIDRPLDPSGNLCRPPLDPSAGVCFVKRKVESSNSLGSNFSPYLLDGACY
jgi:hypothetical protein